MRPLHLAIEMMDLEGVRSLLDAGADPNEPDPALEGFRPLHLSIDIECEDACRRHDAGERDAHPEALITSLLLRAGATPDLLDEKGNSARQIASERNHIAVIKLFEERS